MCCTYVHNSVIWSVVLSPYQMSCGLRLELSAGILGHERRVTERETCMGSNHTGDQTCLCEAIDSLILRPRAPANKSFNRQSP